MNLWNALKIYLSDKFREVVRRQELINYLSNHESIRYVNNNTIDTYRNYLTQAGYLIKIRPGHYRVEREIPIDISVSDIRYEAYGNRTLLDGNILTRDININEHTHTGPSYNPTSNHRPSKDFLSKKEMEI